MHFQDVIMQLHEFWRAQGCVLWRPHNFQVGAGTANPATLLRVLGEAPWRVAYLEPSVRPDDGRYGENPNRLQMHHTIPSDPEAGPRQPTRVIFELAENLRTRPTTA